jgi:NADH-quinone oxidoreductase subunit N
MTIQSIDATTLAPTALLALGGLAALLVDLVTRRPTVAVTVGVLSVLVAVPFAVAASGERTLCISGESAVPQCAYVVDPISVALQLVVLLGALVVLLLAHGDVVARTLPGGELTFLLLSSAAGAVLVPAANDLVTLIVALEVVSLPVFALVALNRRDPRAAEGAMKAFVYSIASVAVSLYGLALLYGDTGVVTFPELHVAASEQSPSPIATTGLVLVMAVMLFKVAAVPFHFWAPDTYESATVPVAAYLSVVSKAAGFAALLLVTWAFAGWSSVWAPALAVVAAATMLMGNVVALRQSSAVRLLAWSSIAQAGYILVPLAAVTGSIEWSAVVTTALIGYLAVYAAMNLGAFAVVTAVARTDRAESLDDYRSLARRRPWLGVSLAFFLACLAGLPPGVIGLLVKVDVLAVPAAGGVWWLAAAMAVATVIGVYYYLAWAASLFRAPATGSPVRRSSAAVGLSTASAVSVCLVATVALSVLPSLALGLIERL